MLIEKKSSADVQREGAHGGSGGRRMYLDKGEIPNIDWQALTYGYLPAGSTFDWHNHEGIEEIMFVLKGAGVVSDREGDYDYSEMDLYHFPAGVEHRIHNPTDEEHEFIFIRINSRS
jgi:cupin domain